MIGYKYGDPVVHQRGADLCEPCGRRGKTELHGETGNEVYLEEPADINAVLTKAENTKGRFTPQ